MSTTSKAFKSQLTDKICQGDIFQNVRYNYIDSEDDEGVNIIEFEFPMAIIISQACDVIAMEDVVNNKSGKPAKFMPSILMCPIYDKSASKSGDHIKEAFSLLSLNIVEEPIYFKDDLKTADKDWHYRFHSLTIETGSEKEFCFIYPLMVHL